MSVYTIIHFSLMGIAAVFTGTAVFIAREKASREWLGKHRGFAVAALLIALAGFLVMAYYKQVKSFPHFSSGHAIGGLVTLISIMVTMTLGNLLTKGKTSIRGTKVILGRVTAVLVFLTVVFGILRLLQIMNA